MKQLQPHRRTAFTLIELLVVIAVIALLPALLLPVFPRVKSTPAMAVCANNQKGVSLAFVVWVNDSAKGELPWRVDVADGGTKNHPSGLQNNVWFQYAWLSNELLNPKVLACPSDKQAKPAETFTSSAQGGFLNSSYQNEACSYNLGLDAHFLLSATAGPLVPDAYGQDELLISDRNANTRRAAIGSCSSGLNPVYGMNLGMQWLQKPNYGHGTIGNVALCDGSVRMAGSKEFTHLIAELAGDSTMPHCLQPRSTP